MVLTKSYSIVSGPTYRKLKVTSRLTMTLLGQRNTAGTELPVLTGMKRRRRRRTRSRTMKKNRRWYGLHRVSGVL